MPFNLLIFPIMGGYYILIRSERFRYRQQRVEAQKIILNSILAGIILMAISLLFTISLTRMFPDFVNSARSLYPLKLNFFGTSVCSFLIAVAITEVTNLFFSEDVQISNAIKKIGNELERLLEYCYRNSELVQFTLKNDKCYVGWIQSLPIPSHSNYIRIFPVYSGYRKNITKKLVFTTQYLDVYAEYVKEGLATDIEELTTLIICANEVVSANQFSAEMYDRFQKKNTNNVNQA
jgi:hypothetical protein